LVRKENYKLGKKHGSFCGWYLDGYNEFKESYINDTIDGECIYWSPTGEIDSLKTYSNGRLITEKKFKVDSTILRIIVYIKGEHKIEGKRNLFYDGICKKDTIKLLVAKTVIRDLSDGESVVDTILLNNYKVLSFKWGGAVYDTPEGGGHDDVGEYSNSEAFPSRVIDYLCNCNHAVFDFYDIIIMNPLGYNISLPNMTYYYQTITYTKPHSNYWKKKKNRK